MKLGETGDDKSDSDGGDDNESEIVDSDDTLMKLGETRDNESDSDGGDDNESEIVTGEMTTRVK